MAKNKYGFEELKQRLTKVQDALQYINEAERLDLKTISETDLEQLLDSRFPIFMFTSAIIPIGTKLFRARFCKNNKPYEKVGDIFAPPSHLITEYGRANRPHERVFYCASNYKLAVGEVLQNLKMAVSNGNFAALTVGVWETIEELHVTNIIHSPVLHQVRPKIFEEYKNLLESHKLRHSDLNFVTSSNLVCQFFADQFTKTNITSHEDYKISALYTRRLNMANALIAPLYSNEKFDGVNYPSVALRFSGDNQALFIESAISKIKIVNALQVQVSMFNFEKGILESEILHIDESIYNGLIKWNQQKYPYPQITSYEF